MRLTHPNERVASAGLCWVSLLTQLINRPDNQPATFRDLLVSTVQKERFNNIESWVQEAWQPLE
jgi:hypothetical protein